MKRELVIVLDFGGQYNQLVARRVRESNVYCEIYSYRTDIETIKSKNPKGIILTGGPNSCYLEDSPTYSRELFELGIPVLGLCYGAQLMMHVLGGKVERAAVREYGKTDVMVDQSSKLFENVSEKTVCWMSHFDYISQVAPGFAITAHTADCPVAAAEDADRNLYAIQFHPEVLHTQEGKLHPGDPREGGRRQSPAGPLRRRGLLRGGGPSVQNHRDPAYMRLRGSRPSPQG